MHVPDINTAQYMLAPDVKINGRCITYGQTF